MMRSCASAAKLRAAALSEVTVEDYVEGRGEDARQVKRVKFKLHDKQAALVALARHLGRFDPKARQPLKVEVNIADVRATILSRLARIAAAQKAEGGDPGDEPRTITEVPTAGELGTALPISRPQNRGAVSRRARNQIERKTHNFSIRHLPIATPAGRWSPRRSCLDG